NAGTGRKQPRLAEELAILLQQNEETLRLYGAALSNKTFRKHLGWVIARLYERDLISAEQTMSARAGLLGQTDNDIVRQGLREIYDMASDSVGLAA
ncbi:MAG TPA: hypothetical protein VII21_05195, partial [Aestuariivirga sp.]